MYYELLCKKQKMYTLYILQSTTYVPVCMFIPIPTQTDVYVCTYFCIFGIYSDIRIWCKNKYICPLL